MPQRKDEPLRKVTLNLYESDCQWFEKEYGYGWSERLRQHVHNEVQRRKPHTTLTPEQMKERVEFHRRRTLGDLSDD